MPFNDAKSVEVPLEVFGGLVTEMSPNNLPLGVSPDCRDVEFLPGSVASRRSLRKVFDTPMGTATLTYAKSYVDNKGTVRDLYLDSTGTLYVEDVSGSPGTYSTLATVTPGSYAKSITAFGREYIAVSDGQHGADIPLQYDGTNLDRVTQDGPGSPPSVTSIGLPSVALAAAGAGPSATISSVVPTALQDGGYYITADVNVASGASAFNVGDIAQITGTSATFNQTYSIVGIVGDTAIVVSFYFAPGTATYIGAGTIAGLSGSTLTRNANTVTATTVAAHQLQVGYQVQITGIPAATVGTTVSSITVNNQNLSGVATVVTSAAHGLVPGLFVSITGVNAVTVGTAISSIVRAGQVVTCTTSAAHGLSPRAVVTITGVTTTSFNTTAVVSQVTSATTFTFAQVDSDASDSTGTVTLNWPIPDTPDPTYFQVLSAPTATSFQVDLTYSNGTWTSGLVKYAWDGTFIVASVPDTTTFTYQQYGPNAATSSAGTATPYGQAAPGNHQCQVAFLTRQGYITAPSPPVKFVASGGQYVSVTNIPIGPSNIEARILLFTGAGGAFFYYIPVPAQVNGQVVATSTVVNDNTTTAVLLDFSDNTLFAAIGTSKQGNNLAEEITLDGALGFGSFGSRLFTYGQRNRVINLLNMGFDGGYLPTSTGVPTGWTSSSGSGGFATGRYGEAWGIIVTHLTGHCGTLSQPMYEDAYGAPIAIPSTAYRLRCWARATVANAADLTFTVAITSASTGFSSTAAIAGAGIGTTGDWLEADFSNAMPADIPADLTLSLYAASTATDLILVVDELSIIYAKTPYRTGTLWSYANNPEAFAGVSGQLGPKGDDHPVFGAEVIRNNLYLWTQDPSGRLHITDDNGTSEPSGWNVSEVAANCGLLSTFGLTVSQADDSTGSGAEEWAAWASVDGAMIFSGATPEKISQEIQPNWENINSAARKTIWCANDYVGRALYFGLPTGSATAPNVVLQMTYRQLNTAAAIAANAPFRVGYSGKLIATDNARKWTPWNLPLNSAGLLYRDPSSLSLVFCGGNGFAPNTGHASFGNAYTLGPRYSTDDDYGQILPYYTSAPFVGPDAEAALGLGSHRKLLAYYTSFVSGVGALSIQVFCDSLSNMWPLQGQRPLLASPKNDLNWAGGSAIGERLFIRNISTPVTGTDNGFNLTHMVAVMRPEQRMPVRGAPQS